MSLPSIDPVLKDAIIRLVRVALTAGIVAGIGAFLKIGTTTDPVTILHVVIGAFFTGVIAALMDYLRTVNSPVPVTPEPGPVTAGTTRVRVRAGALRIRDRNIFDYFPI